MEHPVDPVIVKEDEDQPLEIDPGLLSKNDHISWLFQLINFLPTIQANQSIDFCIACSRYLTPGELVTGHRHQDPSQNPHHLFPLIVVQRKDICFGGADYYVSVQSLKEIQVPIGDVLSHLLPHHQPQLLPVNAAGNNLARCLYIYPQIREEIWQGETMSGRCAFRECERIFNNRQSHLRLYGITPQFCSISCKIRTWLCCNT